MGSTKASVAVNFSQFMKMRPQGWLWLLMTFCCVLAQQNNSTEIPPCRHWYTLHSDNNISIWLCGGQQYYMLRQAGRRVVVLDNESFREVCREVGQILTPSVHKIERNA